MRTLLPDPPPAELQAYLDHRADLGLDRRDEVWEGVLHVVPAPSGEHAALAAQVKLLLARAADAAGMTISDEFNLGAGAEDFRVPDGGLHRAPPRGTWLPSAALVIEILSPGEDAWLKLPFYAKHGVEEILIVDPERRQLRWLGLRGGSYEPIDSSGVLELAGDQLAQQIDWPV